MKYVGLMCEIRNAFSILSENLQGRPRCRWENNIQIDLIETECEVLDLTVPGQSPVVGYFEYGNKYAGCVKHKENS